MKTELLDELGLAYRSKNNPFIRAAMMRDALDRHRETRFRVHVEDHEIVIYRLERVEVDL